MTYIARSSRTATVGALVTAFSLAAGGTTASADTASVLAPLVDTKCSYAQITAALKADAPDLAALLNGRPQAQARLQQLLALPIDQRQQRLDQQLAANPQAQNMINAQIGSPRAQELTNVVNDCSRY
jgi:hemophore-related protein